MEAPEQKKKSSLGKAQRAVQCSLPSPYPISLLEPLALALLGDANADTVAVKEGAWSCDG